MRSVVQGPRSQDAALLAGMVEVDPPQEAVLTPLQPYLEVYNKLLRRCPYYIWWARWDLRCRGRTGISRTTRRVVNKMLVSRSYNVSWDEWNWWLMRREKS